MPMLTYRYATAADNEDLDLLTKVGLEALQDLTLHKDTPPNPAEFATTIRHFLSTQGCYLLLVEKGKDVIGFLAFATIPDILFPKNGQAAMEMLLWVRKEHRSQGVFRNIVTLYEKAAKELNCSKICLSCLETPEENRIAKLYQHVGFKRMETTFVKEIA